MNSLEIILLVIILFFEAFQFATILNVIKRVINSLQDRIHEIIRNEIAILLNDKDLYDSLKDYFGSLAQGIMTKLQPKGSNNMLQNLLGTILQRFIPTPKEIAETSKNEHMENKISKNPFTK